MILSETYTLNNGVKIPKIGLGTWLISDQKVPEVVKTAVKVGYRHIDTAQVYLNEHGVGEGIKTCGVPREKLFVTTKLAAEAKTYETAKASIDASLKRLNVDYIDLMIIHAPQPWLQLGWSPAHYKNGNLAAYRALEDAYKAGKLKAIGVSNFKIKDLENILENCEIKPAVNQILNHVGNTPEKLIDFCKQNDILVESYSPLGHGHAISGPEIEEMAKRYKVSTSQLCMKYVLEMGTVALPKATSEGHLRENASVDFNLKPEDFEKLRRFKFRGYGLSRLLPVYWFGKQK